MKSLLLLKVLLFVSFVIQLPCFGEHKEFQDQLTVGLESEPERLNPITIKDPQTFRIAWQIYEGLFGLDENGQIVPKIAEKWATKDYKTWTFYIRKNVAFHPSEIFGSPGKTRYVNAHDVLYSYTRFCSSESYSSFVLADSIKGCSEFNAKKSNSVGGLKVIDEYTFQIELNKPEPFFINRITSPWIAIFPKEAEQEKFRERWGLKLAVGTGPYRLISRTDNEIVLVKNGNYWDKESVPKIGKLTFRIIKNDQLRFTELIKEKIDLMKLPNTLFPLVFDSNGTLKDTYNRNFTIKPVNTFNTHLIGINLKQVTDVHLRRAMFYGVNRDEIVQKILYGYGEVIGGAVPPGMNGYIPAFKNLYSPKRAKNELKQSHYTGSEIELLVHDLANSEQIGQIFQKQMNDIGIRIKLVKLDFQSVIGRMIKGNAQLFSMFADVVFSSPEPLLINLFTTAKIPVPNFWHYSNKYVDQQLENLRNLNDSASSVQASAKIEKVIMNNVPALFLYRQKDVVIFSNKFKNLRINGHNHYIFEEIEKVQ
ncbi:MAG: ABC transporter substrate-binding protein [Candidatus Jettenia caeni]|nr:MAG: ABC transporter substrate-binding protein [Candidatus Jettenia caeni]